MSGQPDPGAAREPSEAVRKASTLARFFFLKTTFGILLAVTLVVGGLFSYNLLVKEALPDLDIPQAMITTSWPGADPQTMERQVTDVIEDELATLQGVRSINSASFDSFSIISVEFQAGVNSVDAMARLRAAVSDAEADLPAEAERPAINQLSVDDRPILTLALYGDADAATLSALVRSIRDRLERITGVNEVDLGGAREEIVQILLQPERLLALALSPTQIRSAIQQANIEQPFGEIQSPDIGAVVRLEGRFRDLDDLRALPVATLGQGAAARTVRLDEVATVQRTLEADQTRAFFSTGGQPYRPSTEVSVRKTPGADTVLLVEQIFATLSEMQQAPEWPQGVAFAAVQDDADQIWSSLSDVFVNGLQAMLVVFAVLFLAISWREGVIAGLSIPVTFAGVLLAILLFGYSLNELVIIGMVIALGLIIDVFIIMVEGLHEDIYLNRRSFGESVLATVDRYAVPALAGQLTTVLALAPLMAIGGIAGEFIRVLPVTTITCLVLAFVVALLATLPLSRFLLGRVKVPEGEQAHSRADRVTVRAMDWLEAWNSRHVLSSRARAWLWVIGAVLVFAISLFAIAQSRVELYPAQDGPRLGINIELPPTTQLAVSQQVADQAGEILRNKPYLESTIKLVGRKSPFTAGSPADALQPTEAENFIGFSAIFVDRDLRDAPSYELADVLRDEIAAYLERNVAGATLQVVAEAGGPSPGDPIEIQIIGPDMDTLRALSQQVQNLLRNTAGAFNVRDNLGALNPEVALRPNREALEFFGISHAELAAQIRIAMSNDVIGTFTVAGGGDDIDIRLGTEWATRPGEAGGPGSIEEIALVRAYTPAGESVSLFQLVRPLQSEGAVAIAHRDGERALTVLARNQDRTVGEIMADVEPALRQMQAGWPPGYSFAIRGEAEEAEETFGAAGIALVVAIILVMGVLVIVFDSFRQSFIILATMPLALIGTFLGFFLFGISFSFFAMVGVISLVGIVVNNGIVMVDTMNRTLRQGVTIAEAAAAGSARRLRPVLTTSVTTIVGLIPLAVGSPMYRPLTLVIIFGLVSATVLSLFVVPALYLLLTPEKHRHEESLD
ncbi:MAG TPA: efflux RND transporter permease subunit [Noviherbaspirillum sp.]|nr:efflux RND transporter permease subunit [Noviherbaspirillum sp.]